MYKHLLAAVFFGASCSLPLYAGAMETKSEPEHHSHVSMGIFGGYGEISDTLEHDGSFAQQMITLGYHPWEIHGFTIGGEIGVQAGNIMRLKTSPSIIEALGGFPVEATLKPLMDLLIGVKKPLPLRWPVSILIKGGVDYRQFQFVDRISSKDTISKITPELMAGFGYELSKHAMLALFYEGIYSKNTAGLKLQSAGNVTISNVPTLQAGFIGVEYTF